MARKLTSYQQLEARLTLAATRRLRELTQATKAVPATMPQPVTGRWQRIFDTYPGQWQQDVEIELDSVLTFATVFACIRLISSDIGKLRIRLVELQASGVWREIQSPAFSPVLRKPNGTQTRIKFYQQWTTSRLISGKTFVLKSRDARGVVTGLHVLDPNVCEVLVSPSGAVFYRLQQDFLAGVPEEVVVPAREIIHDVYWAPAHPLVGVSPIGACGLAATQGLKMQKNSAKFFSNMSRAGFVLTAPGAISDETAARLKEQWEANFGGENYGRTAVLGDGLEPKSFTISPEDAALVAQLEWTSYDVCRAFGVPPYKVAVGPMPTYNNIEALDQAYYSQTLQEPIESIELLLDEGLELPSTYGTEFDLDGLIRMDTMTQASVHAAEIKAGYLSPNEARAKRGYEPVKGGDTPYMQQQNYSLGALDKRDTSDDPFGKAAAATPPAAQADEGQGDGAPEDESEETEEVERYFRSRAQALLEQVA